MASFKKITLKAVAYYAPVQRVICYAQPTVEINLMLINATAPPCDPIKQLCFPDRDVTPHITENRLPGALYQLRRLARSYLCPDYSVSYSIDSGR